MELVEVLMVLVIFFSLAYTALEKEHVSIDLVVSRLPRRIQAILDSFASLLGVLVLGVISWQLGARAWENMIGTNPMHTSRLLIPYAPFLFIAALGSALFCLYLLWSFIHLLGSVFKK
jgi:TRAP-type C4-dicarboxylate transport system permease small subunit